MPFTRGDGIFFFSPFHKLLFYTAILMLLYIFFFLLCSIDDDGFGWQAYRDDSLVSEFILYKKLMVLLKAFDELYDFFMTKVC